MSVKVTVTGPNAEHVEHVGVVTAEGDLARVMSEAAAVYRRCYPDAEPFGITFKVARA